MRIWEFGDNKALASDLVLEQDFILRVRRMQRLGTPHLVVNLVLHELEPLAKSQRALEAVQDQLKEFARVTQAVYAEMSNGDAFMTWGDGADPALLTSRLTGVLLPDGSTPSDPGRLLLTFAMPQDYMRLRERVNAYVEMAQAAALAATEGTPAQVLKSAAARGPLTAWSVDQIGRLLSDIDLPRYGRTQPICRPGENGQWIPVSEEYFISFDSLRRERFPGVTDITPEHLFLALCETLDQQLLQMLIDHPEMIKNRVLHFNLSVAAVMGSVFARFAHDVPPGDKPRICFELHSGDLLQDFARSLGAIETLKREGFKVALDGLTPDMVPYLNLPAFDADYIKINVSRDCVDRLAAAPVREGLARLSSAKLIFFRCDNEQALASGRKLGIGLYQGWMVDDAAQQQDKS